MKINILKFACKCWQLVLLHRGGEGSGGARQERGEGEGNGRQNRGAPEADDGERRGGGRAGSPGAGGGEDRPGAAPPSAARHRGGAVTR